MKVVLFCGGFGLRMRDGVQDLPKPMVMVGARPLIWHVMRYYAHFGHKEFILAMGYGARHIIRYFRDYDETDSNDFVVEGGTVRPLSTDLHDWSITLVQTGEQTSIGERLRRVEPFLGDDEMFLANYADVFTDAPLDRVISRFEQTEGALLSLLAVPPQAVFHVVDLASDDTVTGIRSIGEEDLRENGGFFVMRRGIFDYLREGEELVPDAVTRLAQAGRVTAYRHDGFWMAADTVKERVHLDRLATSGTGPWELWRRDDSSTRPAEPVAAEVVNPATRRRPRVVALPSAAAMRESPVPGGPAAVDPAGEPVSPPARSRGA